MKKTFTVFFAVVCIGLIFACSKTENTVKTENNVKTEWVISNEVTVAWDAPTSFGNGTDISQDVELKYNVYIDKDTDNTHDDKELVTDKPIATTQHTIKSIQHKGKYFIGVQAIAQKYKDGKKFEAPIVSNISWSSNQAETQSGAFGIEFK